MIRIEIPKVLAWFQTPQTMFRGSKTPRREGKPKKNNFGAFLEGSRAPHGHHGHFWKWPGGPGGALEPLKKAPIFGFFDVSRPRRRFWPPKHGLRCLQPSQIFRKFNSDRFPFFKNLKRTSGTKVRSFWRQSSVKSWISSKLLKIACWQIGLKDLWMLSALWSSWPRCCSVLVCFCLFVCLLVFLSEKRHAQAWHF